MKVMFDVSEDVLLEDRLEAEAAPARVGDGAKRARENILVTGEPYAETTVWMLAVRDQRDKVAFGHLFDHFAPV